MPTSGLVITLSSDALLAERAVASVNARSEFATAERKDRWLPVAMEAPDDARSRELHDWLHGLPGVDFVDVVYVHFENDESADSPDVAAIDDPPPSRGPENARVEGGEQEPRGEP